MLISFQLFDQICIMLLSTMKNGEFLFMMISMQRFLSPSIVSINYSSIFMTGNLHCTLRNVQEII